MRKNLLNYLNYKDLIEPKEENKKDDFVIIKIGKQYLAPDEIRSHILCELKEQITKKFNLTEEEPKDILTVINVPSNIINNQYLATRNAFLESGFKVFKIINEPAAAALAYCMNENVEEVDYFLFLGFGGDTFDVSILQFLDENSCVIIINGDQHLGGNDFNNALLDYCFSYLLDKYKINLKYKKYKKEYRKARISCKKFKIKICNR